MLSQSTFNTYVAKMRQLNTTAAEQMQKYIDRFGFDNMTAVVNYAHEVATQYGEASGELASLMYDMLAEDQGANVPPAVPAQTATYSETWGAVQGSYNESEEKVPDAVGRLVKQTGADTMKQNAARDHAEMAFVPVGDTCAFCIMLASRGWERVGKNAKSHAAHIHPNCDCQYIVRFSPNEGVEGYDENRYKKIYYDADPEGNWKDKLNAIRRSQYAEQETVKIPEFKPAKNIAEAEEFAKQFIQGGNYSSVDYAGIDLEYANEFNRAMNDVLSQYEPRYKLQNIKPMNMRSAKFKGSTADAAYQWGSNDLFYNKGYFKSAKELAKHRKQYNDLLDQVLPHADELIKKYSSDSGFVARKQSNYLQALKASGRTNVGATDPYKTMVHELGHYLDDTVFRHEMKQSGFDLGTSFEKFAKNISAYSTESKQEYVAESFLSYMTGEKEILDPELIKVFERAKK